jgi:hypothetical protein
MPNRRGAAVRSQKAVQFLRADVAAPVEVLRLSHRPANRPIELIVRRDPPGLRDGSRGDDKDAI